MIALVRRHGAAIDLAIGVFAAAVGIAVAASSRYAEGPLWANVIAFAAYGAALAARGRAPVLTAYGFAALVVVMALWLLPPARAVVIFLGLLLFPYTAGASHEPVLSRWYPLTVVSAITVVGVTFDGSTVSDYVVPAFLALAAYGAGRDALVRSRLAAELHESALRAEEANTAEERRAVAAERRRVAREMHDVVAHSISVMVVQAGGARRILGRDPQRAADAAAAIEATGRETLLEMRRLLGVMHPGEAPAELEPTPTLADLGALCERQGARLRIIGHPQPLPPGLEVGAYRIVQEALADARRVLAACRPRADVVLEWTPLALSIRVADDRYFPGSELVGVRERVGLYGGSAVVGPRNGTHPPDGHQLEVRLPLPDAVLEGAPRP